MVVYHPIFFPIYSVKQKKQYYASHGSHFKQTDNVYEMPMLKASHGARPTLACILIYDPSP